MIYALTDYGAERLRQAVARHLGDRQQQVTDQQARDVERLAAPVQHVVAGRQQKGSGQRCAEEHHRDEEADGQQHVANVLCVALGVEKQD